jgi:hypothetical protein
VEGVRQSWCAETKEGFQGEEVRYAGDSREANTMSRDMVTGPRGQVKKVGKSNWAVVDFRLC